MQTEHQVDAVVNRIMQARNAASNKGISVNRNLAIIAANIDEVDPIDLDASEDWRGEHHVKIAYTAPSGGGMFRPAKLTNKPARQTARRDRVQVLHGNGKKYTEIAAEIGCCSETVKKDLVLLGLI